MDPHLTPANNPPVIIKVLHSKSLMCLSFTLSRSVWRQHSDHLAGSEIVLYTGLLFPSHRSGERAVRC